MVNDKILARLAAIKARRTLITGERWLQTDRFDGNIWAELGNSRTAWVGECESMYDARFIAAAPDDIDYLLALVDGDVQPATATETKGGGE
jgi:hypothetical protein